MTENKPHAVKVPKSIRIIEIVLGAITVILAGLILADPAFALAFVLIILSMSLLFGGVEGIVIGAIGRRLSKGQRVLRLAGGIVAVGLSIAVLAFPTGALLTLVVLLSVGLLFLGASGLAKGALESRLSPWVRALYLVVGAATVTLSAVAIAAPTLGVLALYTLLAVTLIINGAAYITTGIVGVVYVPLGSSAAGSRETKKKWQSDAT